MAPQRRGSHAAQAPEWEPGTAAGYHSVTQGFLVGEVVRRITGRSVGEFFADDVAGPLGADFHMGLPAEHDHRVALSIPPPSQDEDYCARAPGAAAAPASGGLIALSPPAGWPKLGDVLPGICQRAECSGEFSNTATWAGLSEVKGAWSHPAQRSASLNPVILAMRSSSEGHM